MRSSLARVVRGEGSSHLRIALLALLVLIPACKCQKAGGAAGNADPARYATKSSRLVVVVPDLGKLGEKIKILESLKIATFLAQTQGLADARELTSMLMAQLGVDLRSRESIEAVGIDSARGVAVVALGAERFYSVVAVKDEAKLRAFLANFAANRLGASVPGTRTEGAITVQTFSRNANLPPELGYVVKDGVALIAPAQSIDQLPKFAALAAEESISTDAALKASVARQPAERDFLVYVPAKPDQPAGTTAVRLTPEALTLHADAALTDPNVLKALERKEGENLLARLPADAFLVARLNTDPATLAPYWRTLVGPYLARAFDDAQFDVKTEILDNLTPGASISLSLAPTVQMTGMPELDVRRTNPFRYAHFGAIAEVADPAKAAATLEKIPPIAPKFGARVEPQERNGHHIFFTTYSQGEGVHFAIADKYAVAGAPVGRLDDMIALAQKSGPPPINGELAKTFDARAVAAVIDLHKLADAVRALPPDAWGVGGFAMKPSTVRWLDATDDLVAITLGADARNGAVEAEVSLKFAPKLPPP